MSQAASVTPATGVLAQYHAELAQGRFLIQRCGDCGQHVFFPRDICPHCGAHDPAWVAPSGFGTVYSVTTIRRKPEAGGDYNVCLIDLDEGVRMMSRVEVQPVDAVEVGQRVQARVVQKDGQGLVVFDPVTESAPATITPVPRGPAASAAVHTSSGLQALRGKAAIAGVATFGCGEATGFSEMEVLAHAARAAVADAGLKMSDIDGLCTASVLSTMWPMPVTEYLGLNPRYINGTMVGGSSFVAHLLPAMMALEAGQCNAVLVCYGSTQRTSTFGRAEIAKARRAMDPQPFENPYEPMQPLSAYALAAKRHMHQYGTTRRQLAEVAVAARQWAQKNPEAFMRDPLSIDDVLKARMVSDPLSVRDSCLVTDGGGAFVLVRADRAKTLPKKPVYVLGNATANWNRQISSMHDLTVTAASQSGREAYAMAGLGPKDMDVLALYDAFTINTILFLEDLGFCAKGEGGAFVEGGRIAPGGALPVNTNGGGLSCVHPGMYGIFTLIESVRQLRGEAGERQVAGATVALAHGNGGTLSSQSTAILGTADAL